MIEKIEPPAPGDLMEWVDIDDEPIITTATCLGFNSKTEEVSSYFVTEYGDWYHLENINAADEAAPIYVWKPGYPDLVLLKKEK